MELTFINTQELTTFIITFGVIISFFALLWSYMKWFPPTKRTRICKKFKGQLSFYRPEVYRPIFGWTPFWTSKFNGSIIRDGSWVNNKSYCQENIDTFYQLTNSIIENKTDLNK